MSERPTNPRRHATIAAWLVSCAVVATAVVKVVSAQPPQRAASADERTARRVFDSIAANEGMMRARAAQNFPGDPWSQDDDFHAMESQRAYQQANANRIALSETLRAIDDGLRSGWQRQGSLRATVAPCRPRPVY